MRSSGSPYLLALEVTGGVYAVAAVVLSVWAKGNETWADRQSGLSDPWLVHLVKYLVLLLVPAAAVAGGWCAAVGVSQAARRRQAELESSRQRAAAARFAREEQERRAERRRREEAEQAEAEAARRQAEAAERRREEEEEAARDEAARQAAARRQEEARQAQEREALAEQRHAELMRLVTLNRMARELAESRDQLRRELEELYYRRAGTLTPIMSIDGFRAAVAKADELGRVSNARGVEELQRLRAHLERHLLFTDTLAVYDAAEAEVAAEYPRAVFGPLLCDAVADRRPIPEAKDRVGTLLSLLADARRRWQDKHRVATAPVQQQQRFEAAAAPIRQKAQERIRDGCDPVEVEAALQERLVLLRQQLLVVEVTTS